MLNKIKSLYYQKKLVDIYTKNTERYGFNFEGLFWNSISSQHKRFFFFLELLKKLNLKKPWIADVGCGNGELLTFLQFHKFYDYYYFGYDINPIFVKQCRSKFNSNNFFVNNHPTVKCDICLMSGTYNFSVSKNYNNWENYVLENITECFNNTSNLMSFNLQYSSEKKIKNNIFYVNVNEIYEKLRHLFKNVEFFFLKDLKKDIFFVVKK